MIDFEAIQRRNEAWRKEARELFVPGIDPADLKPGLLVTMSPDLVARDYSYCDDIWRVLAVNAIHVQVEAIQDGMWKRHGPRLIPHHRHHFYSAEGFAVPETAP